jgi:hypothetical protein
MSLPPTEPETAGNQPSFKADTFRQAAKVTGAFHPEQTKKMCKDKGSVCVKVCVKVVCSVVCGVWCAAELNRSDKPARPEPKDPTQVTVQRRQNIRVRRHRKLKYSVVGN